MTSSLTPSHIHPLSHPHVHTHSRTRQNKLDHTTKIEIMKNDLRRQVASHSHIFAPPFLPLAHTSLSPLPHHIYTHTPSLSCMCPLTQCTHMHFVTVLYVPSSTIPKLHTHTPSLLFMSPRQQSTRTRTRTRTRTTKYRMVL